MKFGSLFAGIGGLDLGLERAGMTCAWQVEIDDYCQRVLAKHWPDVERFTDVREVGTHNLETVDLIAGGFPCQPHSVAGKRKGAEDDRNLWPEFIRIIRETKPRYVIAENVPGIISTYIDTVLSDLENEGYTTRTFNLPAVAFDALHRRERIFIVAHSTRGRRESGSGGKKKRIFREFDKGSFLADSQGDLRRTPRDERPEPSNGCSPDVADSQRIHAQRFYQGQRQRKSGRESWWEIEPDVGRVAHGIPSRVDRLRGLGNAVVPQIAEWIGRRIIEYDL